jgi:hypothetical protein
VGEEARRVCWDGERLRLDCVGPNGWRDSASFRPNPSEWERFWRAASRLGVWQWADGFDRGRRDGVPTWSLQLAVADRRLRTTGFEAYPPLAEGPKRTPVFAGFCAAVSRLVGDRLVGEW